MSAFGLLLAALACQEAPRVVRPTFDRALTPLELATPEARPPLRGFFPPLGAGIDAPDAWRNATWELPARERDPDGARAAEILARRLAPDGLLLAAAQVLELARGLAPEARRAHLAAAGCPLDWCACFSAPGGGDALDWIAGRIEAGASASELAEPLKQCTFQFRPSVPGFQAASESGEHPIAGLRLQITGPKYWLGPDDGGSLDVARQLCAALPDAELRAAIEERHLEGFLATARDWKAKNLVLLPQELPVAQWAQDDGKSGFAGGEVLTLVPRYPCRGDEASSWVPGEARALEACAAQGWRAARSPLLFQGGDLIVVRDPRQGQRVLLLGEAELGRNQALGLTREQVLEAFRIELGVERVLVLPAIAYHIDYELSVRAIGTQLVCFVVDPWPAVQEVLRAATGVLERAGRLDPATAQGARQALEALDPEGFVSPLTPVLLSQTTGPGQFRESFAKLFQDGPADSHVANFHRVLMALDLLLSRTPNSRAERNTQAYLDALRRQMAQREELGRTLREQGWTVVPVPSLSEGARSIDYLNGVQARGLYLMPAWGGLFAALDARVREVFERQLGPDVQVVPILCSESQRRLGAVRCSVGVLPGP